MKTKQIRWGVLGAALILTLALAACASSGESKSSGGGSGLPADGPASFLQNPSHPDGVYDLGGGTSVQFAGQNWGLLTNGKLTMSGKLAGVPPAPAGFEEKLKAAQEQAKNVDAKTASEFSPDDLKAYFAAVQPKTGTITLKAENIYVGSKAYAVADYDKELAAGGLKAKALEPAKPLRAQADTPVVLNYVITDAEPYITLSKQ